MSTSLAIIQARTGSTRLPGKVLARIGDRTVLEHVIDRVRQSGVDRVVIATTSLPEDEPIIDIGHKHKLPVYGGQVNDVLARFADCYRILGRQAKTVVRVTADCPFLDPSLLADVAAAVSVLGCDYAGVKGVPAGRHQEAFTADTLLEAAAEATDPYDREHVVPWMIRNKRVGWVMVYQDGDPCTLDTADDLARLRRMAA